MGGLLLQRLVESACHSREELGLWAAVCKSIRTMSARRRPSTNGFALNPCGFPGFLVEVLGQSVSTHCRGYRSCTASRPHAQGHASFHA